MEKFSQHFVVRWADVDPNWHLRHSAYADYCTQARFSYLNQHGFPAERFVEMGFGPVVFREETRYFREIRLNEQIEVEVAVKELLPDGRWKIFQRILRQDGALAASHELEGAWLDTKTRKIKVAPPELMQLLEQIQVNTDSAL